MISRLLRLVPVAVLLGLILVLTTTAVPAQDPIPLLPPPGAQPVAATQPEQPADPNEPQVLARGPVHEAFASTAEASAPTPVVAKQPPDPIEELPPDQKPEGDNVLWIPGYWHWDEDESQFIWISGFWRNTPPGHMWLPGSWREVRGGWQWVQGFWQEAAPQQEQPDMQYLPPPPETMEVGPSIPAPTVTSFYVPGSWMWNRGRFAWRTGFWVEYRPGWIWVPAHFRWTPLGYVFVDGYWDYPLDTRGVLFAPVYFPQPIYVQPTFVYTPVYVVSEPCMVGALFVRRGWGNYFFGDYFAPRYSTIGFNAWCGAIGPRGGFAIGFGGGRNWGYDPLWSYYSTAYRNDPDWATGVGTLYGGRYRGDIARPPINLVQQNTVINNITNVNVRNVTNNVRVVNKTVTVNNTNITDLAMVAPLKVAKDLQPRARVQPISAEIRKNEAQTARQIREVAVQRKKLEVEAGAKPVGKGAEPRTLKVTMPKAIAARAAVKDDRKPPANPNRDIKAASKVDPKIDDDKPDGSPIFDPKRNPRIDPRVNPKIDPKVLIEPRGKDPKFDPKGKDPKFDPKGKDPKFDPKGKDPKFDPKGKDPKFDPKGKDPKFDPKEKDPKFDPKGKDPRGKDPKSDPKEKDPRFDPKMKDPLPKFDPNPRVDPRPKIDPNPRVDPRPKVDPKGKVDPLPKVDPNPRVDPRPKVDPKGKVDPLPKVDPKSKDPRGKIDPKSKDPRDPKEKDPREKDPREKEKTDPPPPSVSGNPALRSRLPGVSPSPVPRVGPVVNNPVPARQPVFNGSVNNQRSVQPRVSPQLVNRPAVITQPRVNVQPRANPQPRVNQQPRQPVVQPRPPVNQPRINQPRVNQQPRQPVVQPRPIPQSKAPAARPVRAPKQRGKG